MPVRSHPNGHDTLSFSVMVAPACTSSGSGSIISTIVEREYVRKDQGRFTPTMLGERVNALLVKSFDDVFDATFTARLEEELDEIEEGKLPWRDAVRR